ncbi:MAG: MFS transporter [Candidatus Dojkabacteria bacterium]|nr:MFS transporter [Candidatus Dojkabacteria bacterium]
MSLWAAFTIFTFIIDKNGYLKSYRLSFIIQAIAFGAVFIFLDQIEELYIIFAILVGFGRGTFWPIYHGASLKEFQGIRRGKLIDINESIIQILSILLPIMAGAVIGFSNQGLRIIILIYISIILTAVLYPWKYNKKPRNKIRSSEITAIFKKKHFKRYFWIMFFEAGVSRFMGSLFLVIPYILIGNEFGVGGLATLTGIVAAVGSFSERNLDIKYKTPIAYFVYILSGIGTLLLGIIWTVPMLAIRSLIVNLRSSLGSTLYAELNYKVKEKLLGDFKDESALEMNLIDETIAMLGRVFALILSYFFITEVKDIEIVLKSGLIIFAFYPLLSFTLSKKLNDKLKK